MHARSFVSLVLLSSTVLLLVHCAGDDTNAGDGPDASDDPPGSCSERDKPTPGSPCDTFACVSGKWVQTGNNPDVPPVCPSSFHLDGGNTCTPGKNIPCFGSGCTYVCGDAAIAYGFNCFDGDETDAFVASLCDVAADAGIPCEDFLATCR